MAIILDTGKPLALVCLTRSSLWLSLLSQNGEAWGMVERNAAGQRIRLRLEGLESVSPRGRMVPVHEVSGLYSDMFPGLTVADIIDEVRGE